MSSKRNSAVDALPRYSRHLCPPALPTILAAVAQPKLRSKINLTNDTQRKQKSSHVVAVLSGDKGALYSADAHNELHMVSVM